MMETGEIQPVSEPENETLQENGANSITDPSPMALGGQKREIGNVSKDSEELITPPSKRTAESTPLIDPWVKIYISQIVTEKTQVLSTELNNLRAELRIAQAKIITLENDSNFQKKKSDDLEQYSRRQNVRIHGVVEKAGEVTDTVVINELKDHIGLELNPEDIEVSHRVGKPQTDKPRAIICQLAHKKTKSKIFTAVKAEKLRRQAEEMEDEDKLLPIHIVDDLTSKRAALLSEAKKAQKRGKILGAWTTNGKIKIRCLNHTAKYIFTLDDLYRITNDDSQAPPSLNQNNFRGESQNVPNTRLGPPRHSTPMNSYGPPPPHPSFYRFPPPGYKVQYNPKVRVPSPPHGQNPLDRHWPLLQAERPELPGQHVRRPSV